MSKQYPIPQNLDFIATPGLWVDRLAVERNIEQMIIDIGGIENVDRLRPHIKTHKMVEVIKMQVASGIKKCKAATPAEAKIAAEGGAEDILIAHQLVGPKIEQVGALIEQFATVKFTTIVDDIDAYTDISSRLPSIGIWIDLDCGMGRTGIAFGKTFDELRSAIGEQFCGLHVYDGHLHDPSLNDRTSAALDIIKSVRGYLSEFGDAVVVGGGTPTFGIWAKNSDWECSPGTTVFWDCGYGDNYPDLDYEVAAGLVTRIISKPGLNQICLDLGHKAVAAEMGLSKRVIFPELVDYRLVGQSEEHLVVAVPDSAKHNVGDVLTAIPRHICPTVALHAFATVIENDGLTGETWKVAARDRLSSSVE